MKRRIAAVLAAAVLLGLMGACQNSARTPLLPEEPEKEVLDRARESLSRQLDLTEEQAADLVVADARSFEDESIVRYQQTWQGVEIYGSSVVTSSADETFFAGTYYDLSEAFGDDFDAQVAQAALVPEWMTDQQMEGISLRFDRSSLHPVIYITGDGTAVVARCFDLCMEYEGQTHWAQLVTDLSGTSCYHWEDLSFAGGFSDTDVKTSLDDSCTLVKEDGVYYAYNQTYNFYAADRIYQSSGDVNGEDYWEEKNGRLVLKKQDLPVFSRESRDWTKGNADLILRAMNSYYEVADWYFRKFGYYCLDGQGGLGAVIVAKDVEDTVAYNDSNIMIVIEPDVVKAPEVLVHEYGHTVFAVGTGTVGPTHNQTAALKEAICDVFAALYLAEQGDTSWIIGEGAGDPKNIPGQQKTMEDYLYDRSWSYWEADDVPYEMDFWEKVEFEFFSGFGYELQSSTTQKYKNSYIVSNTLYRFWKQDLNKDSEKLGQILYRSLRYMPAKPDFLDFRSAFEYAAERLYGKSVADAAGAQFEKAGIPIDMMGQIQEIFPHREEERFLIDYCLMRYSELQQQNWTSAYTAGTYASSNIWVYDCFMEGAHIYFELYGDYEDPSGEVLFAIISDSAPGMKVTEDLIMGKTYAELWENCYMTELVHSGGVTYTCSSNAEGFSLALEFTGDSPDTAVLTEVQVIYVG